MAGDPGHPSGRGPRVRSCGSRPGGLAAGAGVAGPRFALKRDPDFAFKSAPPRRPPSFQTCGRSLRCLAKHDPAAPVGGRSWGPPACVRGRGCPAVSVPAAPPGRRAERSCSPPPVPGLRTPGQGCRLPLRALRCGDIPADGHIACLASGGEHSEETPLPEVRRCAHQDVEPERAVALPGAGRPLSATIE